MTIQVAVTERFDVAFYISEDPHKGSSGIFVHYNPLKIAHTNGSSKVPISGKPHDMCVGYTINSNAKSLTLAYADRSDHSMADGVQMMYEDFKGIGLGTFLYRELAKHLKQSLGKDIENYKVQSAWLSEVDATKENRERRERFYVNLGFQVTYRNHEAGEGCATIKNASMLISEHGNPMKITSLNKYIQNEYVDKKRHEEVKASKKILYEENLRLKRENRSLLLAMSRSARMMLIFEQTTKKLIDFATSPLVAVVFWGSIGVYLAIKIMKWIF